MSSEDPAPVDHVFGLKKLSYSQPINKQNYIRISMFFNKKPGISYEYFQKHWHHVHADLVTSSRAYKELGIMRYNQFYQTPEARELGKKLGYPIMDFDACTEFWVRRVEDFETFTRSEEYIAATPDMHNFCNIEDGVRVMVGYDNLIFGEAVEGYGKDGVVKGDL